MKLFDHAPLSLAWREFLQSEFKKALFFRNRKTLLRSPKKP